MGDAFCASASVDCGDCRSPYLRPHSPCRNAIVLSGAGDRLGAVCRRTAGLCGRCQTGRSPATKSCPRHRRADLRRCGRPAAAADTVLLALFGLDAAGLAVALIGVAALALPLAMADSATPIRESPGDRVVLTRRNVMLCATAAVTVAVWQAGPGLSYLPIDGSATGAAVPD